MSNFESYQALINTTATGTGYRDSTGDFIEEFLLDDDAGLWQDEELWND